MTIIEKLKNIIKSKYYREGTLIKYFNEFLKTINLINKGLTRIDFAYNPYNNYLYCYIVFYENKYFQYEKSINIKLK